MFGKRPAVRQAATTLFMLGFRSGRSFTVLWIGSIVFIVLLAINLFGAVPAGSLQAAASVLQVENGSIPCSLRFTPTSESPSLNASAPGLADAQQQPSLVQFALQHCLPFRLVYTQLISHNLQAFVYLSAANEIQAATSALYISNGRILLGSHADRTSLQALFAMLKQLMMKVSLPDMMLPASLNTAANVLCSSSADNEKTSSCHPTVSLLPDLLNTHSSNSTATKQLIPRLHQAVWRGSAQICGTWHPSMLELLRFGTDNPHLLDSGLKSWSTEATNPSLSDKRWLKQDLDVHEQASMYTHTIWAPGDGTRLARQLASNALVFIVEGGEPQWYTHLLKPFIHYVPVTVDDTHSNLADMLAWAVDHGYAASFISQQASDFANTFLSPEARECYALQLLFRLHKTGFGNFTVPASAEDVTQCHDLDCCAKCQPSDP